MAWMQVDSKAFVIGGQQTFALHALQQKATEVLPDDKVWGVARFRVILTVIDATTSGMAGDVSGKRRLEYLQNIQVDAAGYKRQPFNCSGRFLRFRAAEIRGKLANADPSTISDADAASVTTRLIYILDFQDARFGAHQDEPIPQASAITAVTITLAELGISGVTFTSCVGKLEVELVPVGRFKVPAPQTCVIEANAGSGSQGDTNMPLSPRPDAVIALSLAYTGNRASGALENAQIDEAVTINKLEIEGKNLISLQTAQAMLERHNAAVPTDAALDESTSAPLVLPLLWPEGTVDAGSLVQTRGGGILELSATGSDGSNAASGVIPRLWIDGYNGVDNKSDHEDAYAMEALGIPRGTPVAVVSKATGKVPSTRVAPFISRTIRPLK